MNKALIRVLFCFLMAIVLAFSLISFINSDSYSGAKFSEEERKVILYLEHDRILGDSNESLQIDGTTLTIYKGGSYQLEGVLDDGQIIVSAGDDEDVVLKLNSVDISCKDSCPLLIRSGGKVKLKLKDNTVNYFRDGSTYRDSLDGDFEPKACIYSREDLIIKGSSGTLIVEGNYKHGIYSADDIRIKSGKIQIKANGTGIRGKDSVNITGGDIDIQARQNGIYGNDKVHIHGGNVKINAGKYGIFGRNIVFTSQESKVSIENALSPVAGGGEIETADTLTIYNEE